VRAAREAIARACATATQAQRPVVDVRLVGRHAGKAEEGLRPDLRLSARSPAFALHAAVSAPEAAASMAAFDVAPYLSRVVQSLLWPQSAAVPRPAAGGSAAAAAAAATASAGADAAAAQLEHRVRELEATLAHKERLLAVSSALNAELAANAEFHRQRLRAAVSLLEPPPTALRTHPACEVAALERELLRLRHGTARPYDAVSTDLFRRLGAAPHAEGLQQQARLERDMQAGVLTRAELAAFVDMRLAAARRDDAAVRVQMVWRSAWAREQLRRADKTNKARMIQRAYRRYRWRKLAWMY
jgi:hypothetical protein